MLLENFYYSHYLKSFLYQSWFVYALINIGFCCSMFTDYWITVSFYKMNLIEIIIIEINMYGVFYYTRIVKLIIQVYFRNGSLVLSQIKKYKQYGPHNLLFVCRNLKIEIMTGLVLVYVEAKIYLVHETNQSIMNCYLLCNNKCNESLYCFHRPYLSIFCQWLLQKPFD